MEFIEVAELGVSSFVLMGRLGEVGMGMVLIYIIWVIFWIIGFERGIEGGLRSLFVERLKGRVGGEVFVRG